MAHQVFVCSMYEFWYRTIAFLMCKFSGKTAIANSVVYFARKSNADMIKVILDSSDVDVNTEPTRGLTALHWAVIRNSSATVSFLLRAGATPTKEALDIAIQDEDEDEDEDEKKDHCRRHVLGLLLAAGVSREDDDELLESCLVYALICDNYTAAALLLAAGAPWEIPSLHRFTDSAMVCALATHRTIAAKELELVGFGEIRDRLLEICVGLHDADLPTPILTLIVEFACEPFASRLPYHYLWDSVVAIRHFRMRRHAPAPQHGDLLARCRKTQDRGLARAKEALEEKHSRAIAMMKQGNFAEAIPLLREVLEVRTIALGERCTGTLATKVNFASSLFSTGCLEEAKALYTEVLQPDAVNIWHDDDSRPVVLSKARRFLDLVLADISKRH